ALSAPMAVSAMEAVVPGAVAADTAAAIAGPLDPSAAPPAEPPVNADCVLRSSSALSSTKRTAAAAPFPKTALAPSLPAAADVSGTLSVGPALAKTAAKCCRA